MASPDRPGAGVEVVDDGSRLVTIPGANHVLIWSHADELVRVTEEFLA